MGVILRILFLLLMFGLVRRGVRAIVRRFVEKPKPQAADQEPPLEGYTDQRIEDAEYEELP